MSDTPENELPESELPESEVHQPELPSNEIDEPDVAEELRQRAPHRIESRRLPVLVAIVVLAVAAGLANSTVKAHRAAAISGPNVGLGAIYQNSNATSTAWYCAGPMLLKSGLSSSAIVLSNLSDKTINAQVDIIQSAGAHHVVSVGVPANSSEAVPLGHSKVAGFAAANVLVNSAAVGVQETVDFASGDLSAPCSTGSTNTEYLPGFSTNPPDNVALSMFDPGATPAVANVTFLTPRGPESPPAFQGLAFEAGQLEVLDVGHYLPNQSIASIEVTSTGGHIVAGALQSVVVGHELSQALINGVPSLKSSWYFSGAPSGPGIRQQFVLANPSLKAMTVRVELGGSSGVISEAVAVPPGGSVVATPVPDATAALRWAQLSAPTGQAFAAGRQLEVLNVPSAPSPNPTVATKSPKGTKTATPRPKVSSSSLAVVKDIAALEADLGSSRSTLSTAVSAPAREWFVLGRCDQAVNEIIVVSNPGSSSVTVGLSQLGDLAARLKPYGLSDVYLAPRAIEAIDLGTIYSKAESLPIVVGSTGSVLVGSVLYAKGSSGSAGLSAPAAIPVD